MKYKKKKTDGWKSEEERKNIRKKKKTLSLLVRLCSSSMTRLQLLSSRLELVCLSRQNVLAIFKN